MASMGGFLLMLMFTASVVAPYFAVTSMWPDHRSEIHSVIAGMVIGGITWTFIPGWAALLVFAGTVWFFFGVSKRGREQERQALVRWRERATRELGMNVLGVGGPPGPGKILVQGLIAQA